ncbi:MAG: hypothetical protein GXO33_05090 [Epsilonproteobacteria bacterium]|nr:hypothetical protein [Campylobacterota bacterium]
MVLQAVLLLLFWGCAAKHFTTKTPAFIVFKTPQIKLADQGFVMRAQNDAGAQIYSGGQPVFELTVGRRICLDGRCMDEGRFYERVMGARYPKGTLQAILQCRPVPGEGKITKTADGWIQRLYKRGRYDIIYSFNGKEARFKERLHRVLIKIREM